MKMLLIPADEGQPVRLVEQEANLANFQAAVGGYIEAVRCNRDDATMYLNEEGKLNGLPINDRATSLARENLAVTDFIVGDAVVVGPHDGEGNDTDCPTDLIDLLQQRGWLTEAPDEGGLDVTTS